MTTTTRYVGTCPVCDARYKVRGDVLVHHGYERPGHGHIVGDCFAVGLLPHEVSSATANAYREWMVLDVARLEQSKIQIEQASDLTYTYPIYEGISRERTSKTIAVQKGDRMRTVDRNLIPSFDEVQKNLLRQLALQIEWSRGEVARMTVLVDTWTEQPLTTVEEETARVTVEMHARRAAKRDERDAKKASQAARKADRQAKLMVKVDAAKRRAQAILDAVDPADVRAVRGAYLVVLTTIKLPSAVRYEFYDQHLDRTALLTSAGLVRAHSGSLMTMDWEVRHLLAGK